MNLDRRGLGRLRGYLWLTLFGRTLAKAASHGVV